MRSLSIFRKNKEISLYGHIYTKSFRHQSSLSRRGVFFKEYVSLDEYPFLQSKSGKMKKLLDLYLSQS